MKTNEVTFHLRLKAERQYGQIKSVKANGVFVNKPACTADETVVKIRLHVPESLFDSPMQEIEVIDPTDLFTADQIKD